MSVDQLKGFISGAGGLAPANRYIVRVNGFDLSTSAVSASFPGRQLTSFDAPYQAVRNNVKYANGFLYEDLTLVFRLTNNYNLRSYFESWQSFVVNKNYRINYPRVYERDVEVTQLNQQNQPVKTARMKQAYPISVQNVELSSESENTISTLTVVMTYVDLEIL